MLKGTQEESDYPKSKGLLDVPTHVYGLPVCIQVFNPNAFGANLSSPNSSSANLSSANLSGVNLSGANLFNPIAPIAFKLSAS